MNFIYKALLMLTVTTLSSLYGAEQLSLTYQNQDTILQSIKQAAQKLLTTARGSRLIDRTAITDPIITRLGTVVDSPLLEDLLQFFLESFVRIQHSSTSNFTGAESLIGMQGSSTFINEIVQFAFERFERINEYYYTVDSLFGMD